MAVLKLKGLSKAYGSSKKILEDVGLELEAGKSIAIVGPSGCGKSTLLKIAGLLDEGFLGFVSICGHNCTGSSSSKLTIIRKQYIGFIYQQYCLLPEFTAAENVAIPLWIGGTEKAKGLKMARELLGNAGLEYIAERVPATMSGGEQQRVAVLRALIKRPKLILADEPTGNLDSESAALVVRMLFEAVSLYSASLLLVTHNEAIANMADKKVSLLNGKLSACTASQL